MPIRVSPGHGHPEQMDLLPQPYLSCKPVFLPCTSFTASMLPVSQSAGQAGVPCLGCCSDQHFIIVMWAPSSMQTLTIVHVVFLKLMSGHISESSTQGCNLLMQLLAALVAGAKGLLAEEEERLFRLRQEKEGQVRTELNRAREELEAEGRSSQSGKLCATPFGVDVVGITELIALTGALVGGK